MEKLLHIKDTRQRQAAVAIQSGMMPQNPMQNQPQGAFPQQMNRGMQSSPVPGQTQMAMGMNDPNQQVAMQQRQQQSAAMLQQQQQRAQQRPGNGVPLPDDLNTLSAQDLDHVSRLASQMLAKTSAEDMEKIKLNLSNMNPEQRQYLARKNMDPMTYFFRSQALNQLRRHRHTRMEMGRNPNSGVDPNGAMMGDPMMNQRQMFQNMMNLQRNNAFPGNPGQGLDPNAFIGNVENIQGQQADGLRSQEAGQLVVPASSTQINHQPFGNQQNMFPQGMNQNGQANMNGANVNAQMFNQPHIQNGNPQDRMQFQAQQSQVQAQARAQAAQKAQMAMSGHGGQGNPQAQAHLSQQSPVMPMLNQPMAPGQMSPAQVPAQARPPSRAPNMGQHPAGVSQPTVQGQPRPQIPPNLPQTVQAQLAQMTNEQLTAFLMTQRRAAMARAKGPQQTAAQAGQNQPMMNGQMGNNRMRTSMSAPQGMTAGGQAQAQQLQGQQLTPQQRQQQQQRQQEFYKLQILRQQNNGIEMTSEQGKEMDRTIFPPSILNNNSSQVPKHIKTWGQLKQWAAANPQAANGVDLPKLMTLQKLHFAQILTHHAKEQNAQGAGHPFQGSQAQLANAEGFHPGQPQPPVNMPTMRPITAQDVQMARQKLGPNSNNFTDDQIRDILRNRQRQILMQTAQNRAQMTGNMAPAQNQSIPQPAVSAPQAVPQAKPQMPQLTEPANAKAQTGAAAKGAKASTGKQASKKRPNVDDTAEARAAATPQQPQAAAPATAAGPSRPGLPVSQEQFNQMSPQQRLQVEAHMRRQQQSQLRGPVINRAAAEAAWNNNLPPKVLEVYNEIGKNAPSSQPVAVSAEQKVIMTQQLRESLDVLGRLDVLVLHGFPKMQGQEKNVKNLLAMRIQLMRQFKQSPEWIVNDQFTITPDYLTGAILFIRKLFQVMMVRLNQQRSNANANANQPPASGPPTTQGGTPALNATNLQQLQQQQEEALRRARRASSQSAAAAPAPFGAPSPQGVPHAYGPGGLAPEKLKLPPPKKRKQSHAGANASPVQASTASVSAAKYKQAVADVKSAAAALASAFKCSVVECQHHFQGFSTQAALDKHVEESHQPEEEEVIENPLQYYLDSIDMGLGLDAKSQQAQQAVAASAASAANKLGVASPVKQGIATPVTANTTPMARATSQLGAKAASPATSTQQLTPRQPPGKNIKKEADQDGEAKDAWAKAPMTLEKLHDIFSPIFSECQRRGQGYDPFEEFLNADMFSGEQSDHTPDSFDVALATLTPDSDTKDEAKEARKWQDWMPWDAEAADNTAKWMEIPPEIVLHDNDCDDIDGVRVDFLGLQRQQKELNLDSTSLAIRAL